MQLTREECFKESCQFGLSEGHYVTLLAEGTNGLVYGTGFYFNFNWSQFKQNRLQINLSLQKPVTQWFDKY